ncbi:MAG: hypothetical protein IKU41_05010 [Clostridia bacterium]|nr:hypothetical protein [Clostridia bacterium]
MTKIEEFENKIIKQGMTDEDFIEYQQLLKRVRDNFNKRQHCYTTAIQFPIKNAEQAIKLIKFGLDNYEDSWFTTYTSYLFIGKIYEKMQDEKSAYDSYVLALKTLSPEQQSYIDYLSIELLWMKLHMDNFQYSPELEDYCNLFSNTDEFSQSFKNNEFRIAIAQMVIALHYGENDKVKHFYQQALEISNPKYIGKAEGILNRHHYKEELKVTSRVTHFLNEVKFKVKYKIN